MRWPRAELNASLEQTASVLGVLRLFLSRQQKPIETFGAAILLLSRRSGRGLAGDRPAKKSPDATHPNR